MYKSDPGSYVLRSTSDQLLGCNMLHHTLVSIDSNCTHALSLSHIVCIVTGFPNLLAYMFGQHGMESLPNVPLSQRPQPRTAKPPQSHRIVKPTPGEAQASPNDKVNSQNEHRSAQAIYNTNVKSDDQQMVSKWSR
jgi:hypothetical protein